MVGALTGTTAQHPQAAPEPQQRPSLTLPWTDIKQIAQGLQPSSWHAPLDSALGGTAACDTDYCIAYAHCEESLAEDAGGDGRSTYCKGRLARIGLQS